MNDGQFVTEPNDEETLEYYKRRCSELESLVNCYRSNLGDIVTYGTTADMLDKKLQEWVPRARSAEKIATEALDKLRKIVDTSERDGGVVLLSYEGTCHTENHDGGSIQVYDHDYSSPLGDALIDLYLHLGGKLSSGKQHGKQESNDGSKPRVGKEVQKEEGESAS